MSIRLIELLILAIYITWGLIFELLRGEEIRVLNLGIIIGLGWLFSNNIINFIYKGKVNLGGYVYNSDDDNYSISVAMMIVLEIIFFTIWPMMYLST